MTDEDDRPAAGAGGGRRLGGAALAAVGLAWALVLVLLLGVLVGEAITQFDESCSVPGLPEAEGEVGWQWWPPGEVCSLGDQQVAGPSDARGWLLLGEVVVGVLLVLGWRRFRALPEPDWTD